MDLFAKIERNQARAKNAAQFSGAESPSDERVESASQAPARKGGAEGGQSDDLKAHVARLEKELRDSRSHGNQAGAIDNETLRKAILYDELQKRQSEKPRQETPERVKELLESMGPDYQELVKHLASESVATNPMAKELSEAVKELREWKKSQEEQTVRTTRQRQAQEFMQLKRLPEFDKIVTPDVDQKAMAILQAGITDSVIEAVEMVTRSNLSEKIKSLDKKPHAPPPPDGREVASRVTDEIPKRSADLKQAFLLAQKDNPDLTVDEFIGMRK